MREVVKEELCREEHMQKRPVGREWRLGEKGETERKEWETE